MEEFQVQRDKALQKIKIADHMLTQTYPLVKDPKLLLAVLDNIFLALSHGMSALLHHERLFKRIPAFVDNFENKFDIYRRKAAPMYSLNRAYVLLIGDVKEIIAAHKKSPVEFARKDSFVICSDSYKMKTISLDKIKDHIALTKKFLRDIAFIVNRNERIFA